MSTKNSKAQKSNARKDSSKSEKIQTPDPVILGKAILDAYQKAQPLFETYVEKHSGDDAFQYLKAINFDPLNIRESYINFLDKLSQDPGKIIEMQARAEQPTSVASEGGGVWVSGPKQWTKKVHEAVEKHPGLFDVYSEEFAL